MIMSKHWIIEITSYTIIENAQNIFIKFSCVMCHIILLHKNILSNNNEIIVEESCYAPIGVIVI